MCSLLGLHSFLGVNGAEKMGIAEIKTLLESASGVRGLSVVVGLVERRLEYVSRNIGVLEVGQGGGDHDYDEEEGEEEGVMEINELLDEEGNVVSASVVRPGDAARGVLDILRRGGIRDFEGGVTTDEGGAKSYKSTQEVDKGVVGEEKNVTLAETPLMHELSGTGSGSTRKVRFAEAVEVGKDEPIEDPVVPDTESPEEAALRREMLEYNMRKIGTIVAEMDLTDDEDDDDDEEDYDDESEQEDEFGRTTMQVVSEEYREKMLELEKKLNAKAIINIGPNADEVKIEEKAGSFPPKTAAIVSAKPEKSKSSQRKGVRFAEELDVQDGHVKMETVRKESKNSTLVTKPVKDEIVEREAVEISGKTPAQKKVSKFKANRMKESMPVGHESIIQHQRGRYGDGDDLYPKSLETEEESKESSNPTTETINQNLLERSTNNSINIQAPDLLDPDLHAAEVRNAYHDMRNKLIQRENGFMNQDMEEYEDECGKPLVSRFKAARLATRQR